MSLSLKATQADGYYQPPQFDPAKHGTLNRLHGTHRLGHRARKIKEGIIIIRFELPYKVWCLACDRILDKGVRFNAEKKKIGTFGVTPIYEFRMTCLTCHNPFVIKTDPENHEYVCVEGCRKRVETFDSKDIGATIVRTAADEKALETDVMLRLQIQRQDIESQKDAKERLERLIDYNEMYEADSQLNKEARRLLRNSKTVVIDHEDDVETAHRVFASRKLKTTNRLSIAGSSSTTKPTTSPEVLRARKKLFAARLKRATKNKNS